MDEGKGKGISNNRNTDVPYVPYLAVGDGEAMEEKWANLYRLHEEDC